jgi:hypothetical protein
MFPDIYLQGFRSGSLLLNTWEFINAVVMSHMILRDVWLKTSIPVLTLNKPVAYPVIHDNLCLSTHIAEV